MNKFILTIVFCSLTISYAQNDSVNNNSTGSFFVTPAFSYNFPGAGIKLNLGYNISKHFSILLSSGYMTSFTSSHSYLQQSIWDDNVKNYKETTYSDAEHTHKFVPIDLSLRYNFNVFGVQSYIFYQLGQDYFFDEGNYNVYIVTKYHNSNQIINSRNGKASEVHDIAKNYSNSGKGIGAGILIPINSSFKIDISYSLLGVLYPGLLVQSLGLGLNYLIK